MTMPNFIVFGTRKAGTTSMYHYLEQHPQVFMSRLKGTRFFHYDPEDPEGHSAIQVRSLEAYQACFEEAEKFGARAIGEVSPTYLYDQEAARRIRETIPSVRLITSLRNPADRAYSNYLMQARNGGAQTFEPTAEDLAPHLDAGRYATHLKRYFELFERDQILILVFEEWIRDIQTSMSRIYEFLGVDSQFSPNQDIQYNVGGVPKSRALGSLLKHRSLYTRLKPYVPSSLRSTVNRIRNSNMSRAPKLPEDYRDSLVEQFRDDIHELEDLLGRDLSIWRDGSA